MGLGGFLCFLCLFVAKNWVFHAQGGVGHSESWSAGEAEGVCSRPKVVITITEAMIIEAANNI